MKLRWWSDQTRAWRDFAAFSGPNPHPLPGPGTFENWTGTSGDDTHTGTKKDDTLDGAGGNDTVNGGKGNDSITGGLGLDSLNGSDGNDSLFGGTDNDTLISGIGTDALDGGDNDDQGDFGASFDATDTFAGGAGNDTMILSGTYAGTITLTSQITGVEAVAVNTGGTATIDTNDNLLAGAAGITIDAHNANILVFNGAAELTGAFTVIGGNKGDTITGGRGADTLSGGKGNDAIGGGLGNDTLNGDDGNDTIHLGGGTDTVNGGAGNDLIVFDGNGVLTNSNGGAGFDTMDASSVTSSYNVSNASNIEKFILSNLNDSFGGLATGAIYEGGLGDDRLVSGAGNDTLNGGDGFDLAAFTGSGVVASLATNTATGEGSDTLIDIEGLQGTNGDDTLTGDGAINHFAGYGGNDTINGGGGLDWLFYNSIPTGNVTVDLTAGTATGALGTDTLSNLENVVMGGGNDSVTGNNQNNLLYGFDGNDTLLGGQGDDFLYGGNGVDTLTGGRGLDVMYGGAAIDSFVFAALSGPLPQTHYISDIVAGETIDLSAIDAIPGGTDQAFIVVESFNGAKGEARVDYNSGTNQTIISLDINGGASPQADFIIVLNGNHILPPNPPNPEAYDITIIW